jgi:hypothetical protein
VPRFQSYVLGFEERGALPIADVDGFATFHVRPKKTPSEGLISNGASSRAGGAHRHTALMRSARGGMLPPVTINYLPGTGLRMDDESRDILPVEQPPGLSGSDISLPIHVR